MFLDYTLQNFKTHKDSSFKLNGLTVLTGKNNSGKSSVIQSLRLLSLINKNSLAVYPRLPFDKVYGLKSFKDALNKTVKPDEPIRFDFKCDIEELDYCHIVLEFDSTALHKYIAFNKKDEAVLSRIEMVFAEKDEEPKKIIFTIEEDIDDLYYRVEGYANGKVIKLNGIVPDINFFEEKYSNLQSLVFQDFSKQRELMQISKFLSKISTEKIKYLNANRMIKQMNMSETGTEMLEHGENTAIVMHSLWNQSVFDGEKTFGQLFNEWTGKILDTHFETRISNSMPRIVAVENEYEFDLEQIGFGNTQILPLITLILSSSKGDLLLIETPEEQLHPKWRANLVEFFYFAVQKGIKLIIETHSIEIINRMRLIIKREKHLNDSTSLYYLDKDGFESTASKIKIEDTGKLSFWPEDFLDRVTVEDSVKLIRP